MMYIFVVLSKVFLSLCGVTGVTHDAKFGLVLVSGYDGTIKMENSQPGN